MTEAELHLMRVRAKESRPSDILALLAEIERLELQLAEAHGTIQGLKDVMYGRVPTHP
jgi:hypothetical protein